MVLPCRTLTDTANSADDVPSAKAIAKGLAAGHTADKPGNWLHICGTGMLQVVRTHLSLFSFSPPPPGLIALDV